MTEGGRTLHCTASPLRSTSSKAGENEINRGMGELVGGDDECDTGKSRLARLTRQQSVQHRNHMHRQTDRQTEKNTRKII